MNIAIPLLILVNCLAARAEPRDIDVKYEIKEATIVQLGKVLSYEKGHFVFSANGVKKSVFYGLYFENHNDVEGIRNSDWVPKGVKSLDDMKRHDFLFETGNWPPIGVDILIVVNKINSVSVFAWKTGDSYRFWSPHFTGSSAFFLCLPPFKPASSKIVGANRDTSWEGCLIPSSKVQSILK